MTRFIIARTSLFVLALSLGGCETAREELGLTRRTPDAFAVVARAPLEMPPTYDLPTPAPGAARPQETAPSIAAQQTLFGQAIPAHTTQSSAEAALLEKTGATAADPDIRARLMAEKDDQGQDGTPVAKRLLNLGKDTPKGVVVDAAAENQRIFNNKQAGLPVTVGETPKAQP